MTRFKVSERFDLRYFVCPWIHKKMRHVGCVFDQGWSSKLYVSFLLSIYECCDVFFLKQTKICYLNKTSKMAHVALKKFVTMATVWAKKAKNVIFQIRNFNTKSSWGTCLGSPRAETIDFVNINTKKNRMFLDPFFLYTAFSPNTPSNPHANYTMPSTTLWTKVCLIYGMDMHTKFSTSKLGVTFFPYALCNRKYNY